MPRLRPQEERPPLPEFREEPVEPPLTLPPPPQPRERLSTGVRVFVRAIRLEGNTVFSTAQLAEVTNPYQGREVTTEDLLRLRDELTRYYVSRGYVNSGAVIPDQDVVDGVITLRIVEGTLDEVRVKGLKWLRPSFVENRIKVPPDRPLNANELQKRLQLCSCC